jgi:inosine-uridine nucleoside N-ribohydrolase
MTNSAKSTGLCGRSSAPSILCSLFALLLPISGSAKDAEAHRAVEKIIIDTDIGADIDDAFAVALALRSPELEILGFSTTSGDTEARAKIIDRMLGESGHADIPVTTGVPTTPPDAFFSPSMIGPQKRYGEVGNFVKASHPAAVDFILEQIRKFPQQVTLVAIGPLSNVGALIDRDISSFRKLRRIVLMGGWFGPVGNDIGQGNTPRPEYNIAMDIGSAQKLFSSGVPVYLMPQDATNHLTLEEQNRQALFSAATPLTEALGLLYLLSGITTPVLHDALPVAYAVDPALCPVTPLRIAVDEQGFTKVEQGPPNAQVCLHSDREAFLNYYMKRVVGGGNTDQL